MFTHFILMLSVMFLWSIIEHEKRWSITIEFRYKSENKAIILNHISPPLDLELMVTGHDDQLLMKRAPPHKIYHN